MSGSDDDTKVPVKVDTFVNYKDESLMQRTEVFGEIQQTVMRIREQQTVEALVMLGWHAPDEVPDFSDAACFAAQEVYNVTPVVFGERARRMRAALIAAMQVHNAEKAKAVAARAAELEAKFAPKPETDPDILLYVSPDSSWRTSRDDDGDLEEWLRDHDDFATINIPYEAGDTLCDELALMSVRGASQAEFDRFITDWLQAVNNG